MYYIIFIYILFTVNERIMALKVKAIGQYYS